MVINFDPKMFRDTTSHPVKDEVDWSLFAIKVPTSTSTNSKAKAPYIPSFPVTFLDAIAPAGDAIRVLLVTMAEIRKRDIEEISLGPSIWAKAGKPSPRVRSRLLSQIAALSEGLCTLTPRKGKPHLFKIGPEWPRRNQAGDTSP
jgi:hypothetical protein